MCAQQLSTNTFTVAKWVVSADATQGTHTTIAGALSSASIGDTIYIRTGTYTENLTLKNGVNICGLSSGGGSGQRTVIVGKLIDNGGSVNCTINNIALQTNSDNILVLTGGGTVVLEEVYINATNATAVSVTSGTVKIVDCVGDLGTTGIAYFTGAGSIALYNSNFTNSGSSTTPSTISGTVTMNGGQFTSCFSTSGSGSYTISDTFIDCNSINSTAFTSAGTGTSTFYNCIFKSGSASALSIGSGTTVNCLLCTVNSSNTNAITGSGTLNQGLLVFSGSSSTINTSTVTNYIISKSYFSNGITFDNTNILSNYVTTTSFTPILDFAGGTTGITYSGRSGSYSRIGNIVTFTLSVELSNKGSSTGTAQITGLPLVPTSTTIYPVSASSLTFTGSLNARMAGGSSTITIDSFATTGSRTSLTDTAFSNSTFVQISGSFLI